jgi:hypothetical protein
MVMDPPVLTELLVAPLLVVVVLELLLLHAANVMAANPIVATTARNRLLRPMDAPIFRPP